MALGFVKVHRELLEHTIWQNSTPEQCKILITLLLMASYKEKRWEFKGDEYHILPGQFVTSIKSIVEKCGNGVTESKVRTALEKFEKFGFLTSKSSNKNRLITIVNWGIYQTNDDSDDKEFDKQIANKSQTNVKQITNKSQTNRNYQEIKEYKEIKEIKEHSCETAHIKSIVDKWNELEYYGIKPIKDIKNNCKRYENINNLIKNNGIDNILIAIDKIKNSPFLCGRGGNGWCINFDWFIIENNFSKVFEGNYEKSFAKVENNKSDNSNKFLQMLMGGSGNGVDKNLDGGVKNIGTNEIY